MPTLALKNPPAPRTGLYDGVLHLHAKALKVTLVIPPDQLGGIDPAETIGKAQVTAMIAVEGHGRLRAKLNAKSLRKALGVIAEHGVEGVAVVLQGRLIGQDIDAAGLAVQPKGPRSMPTQEESQ